MARPVIGFDMGGTSTDVSRYAGEFEHVFETTTAGVTIQSPQVCDGGGGYWYGGSVMEGVLVGINGCDEKM